MWKLLNKKVWPASISRARHTSDKPSTTGATPERLVALDMLRGLMAMAVLVFHFDKWIRGSWDASLLQGKLGVYAVAAFFAISGFALAHVYVHTRNWLRFYLKRVLRIFPLLWLATICTLLMDEHSRSTSVILLNFSGLFGFIDPSADIATGAWSIGCEWVYYAFFPVWIWLARQNRSWFVLGLMLGFGLLAWRAIQMQAVGPMEQSYWWSAYTHWLSHLFFFTAGMAFLLYRDYFEQLSVARWRWILGLTCMLFCCWPLPADPWYLVSGVDRIVLSLISCAAIAAFQFGRADRLWPAGSIVPQVLEWLGTHSYSIYLLHPLVFRAGKAFLLKAGFAATALPLWFLGVGGTLLLSYATYRWIERPFMRLV